jgi:hypothetical protein
MIKSKFNRWKRRSANNVCNSHIIPLIVMSKTSVFCLATSHAQADSIVSRLQTAGFSNDSISALLPDQGTTRDFAHKKATKSPEGAATGAGTGGVLGGALGLLAGIGALAIPGVGPLIAAGPILATLSGAAVGAAVGGLTGALIGMGIPEYEAKRYEGKIREGNILISVHTENSDQIRRVKQIFQDAGAQDISSSGEEGVPSSDRAPKETAMRTPEFTYTPKSPTSSAAYRE